VPPVGRWLTSRTSKSPRRPCPALGCPSCPVSLLFNPSRCLEELRPFVKRLGHGSEQPPRGPTCSVWSVRRKAHEDRGESP
jgi:hypothetical protein